MTVMAAGVHPALVARRVRHAGALLHVQRVEIGAKPDRLGCRICAVAAAEHTDDTGLGEPGVNLESE